MQWRVKRPPLAANLPDTKRGAGLDIVFEANKEVSGPVSWLEHFMSRNMSELHYGYDSCHQRTPMISNGRVGLSIPTTCVIEIPTSAETRRYSAICSSEMLPRKMRYSGKALSPCINGERQRSEPTSSSDHFPPVFFSTVSGISDRFGPGIPKDTRYSFHAKYHYKIVKCLANPNLRNSEYNIGKVSLSIITNY